MVKSETCRDAEILVRNLSVRLFGKKFQDSKNVKQTMQKWDFETDQKRFRDIFRDPTQIFRDPRFSRYHSPPLSAVVPTLPLLAGDLRFFASSPALPLWYINVPLLILRPL